MDFAKLADKLAAGDVRALARALRLVDDQSIQFDVLLDHIDDDVAWPWIVGVTGPAGVGKSSLVDLLIEQWKDRKVGVLAVDPSSPFHSGAMLGDRIRMQRHFDNPNVFIRSVASRNAVGGLSSSIDLMIPLMALAGFERVIIETVGIGQDEVDIGHVADTTLVVLAPGMGDSIQAEKCGLLEIADVIVVNKADREGADILARDLKDAAASRLAQVEASWKVPVLFLSATQGSGKEELEQAMMRHQDFLQGDPQGKVQRESLLLRRAERFLSVWVVQRFMVRHRAQIESTVRKSGANPIRLLRQLRALAEASDH